MLFVLAAFAFDSEPQDVVFSDLADVFSGAEFSTGFVPAGSPLQVQFAIESTGGVAVDMEGVGNLSWPAALTLAFDPVEEGGMFLLDASLDAVTTIAIDLSDWGYYGVFELDRRSLTMDAITTFTPFALEGSIVDRVEVVDPGDATTLIDYSYEIIVGLSLDFTAELRPEAVVGMHGVAIEAGESAIEYDGAAILVPYEPAADLLVDATYVAEWDARLDLILTPTIEACTDLFGCFTIAAFDIPIALIDDTFDRAFPPVRPIFPLPLLSVGVSEVAFGDVVENSIATAEVPLGNQGSLPVYGDARIEGSDAFTVYPTTFNALPGTEDGLMVTFTPVEGAPTEAFLILSSNDPGQPEVIIPLNGGIAVPEDVLGEDEVTVTKTLDGCGCGTGTAVSLLPALLGLAALSRRRR